MSSENFVNFQVVRAFFHFLSTFSGTLNTIFHELQNFSTFQFFNFVKLWHTFSKHFPDFYQIFHTKLPNLKSCKDDLLNIVCYHRAPVINTNPIAIFHRINHFFVLQLFERSKLLDLSKILAFSWQAFR